MGSSIEIIIPRYKGLSRIYRELEDLPAPEDLWQEFEQNIKRGLGEDKWERELEFALLAATDPKRASDLCLRLLQEHRTRQRMSTILLDIEQANHLRMFLKPFRFLFSRDAGYLMENAAKDMQKKVDVLINENKARRTWYQKLELDIKRAGDIFLSIIVLTVAVLLGIWYILAIWAVTRKWPLRTYRRIGYGAKIISVTEIDTIWTRGSTGYTRRPIDRFLYTTALHQIPSYWNVLKGELSIIGPYPLCCYWATTLDDKMAKRFSVLPGMAGLAQVNAYVDKLDWKAYLLFDDEYIENWTIWLDLKLILFSMLCIMGFKLKPIHLRKNYKQYVESAPGLLHLVDFAYAIQPKQHE